MPTSFNPDFQDLGSNTLSIDIVEASAKTSYVHARVAVVNASGSYVTGEVWLSIRKLTGEPFSKESRPVPFTLAPGKQSIIPFRLSDNRIRPGDKIEITAYLQVKGDIAKKKKTLTVPINRCSTGEMLDNSVVKRDVTPIVKKFTSPVKRATLTVYKTGGKLVGTVEPRMSDYQKYAMWKSGFAIVSIKCPKDGLTYYFKVPAKLSVEYVQPDPESVRYKRYEVDPPEKSPYKFNTSGIAENSTKQPKEPVAKDNEAPTEKPTPYLALIGGIILGVLLLVFLRR